jgi:hypothetical protein
MTSLIQQFAAFEQAKNDIKITYPKDLIQEEIDKIKKHLPKSCDMMTCFLLMARPIVEVVLLECGIFEVEKPEHVRGKRPIPAWKVMLILIVSTLSRIGSFREVRREFDRNPAWLKAIGLEKALSHAKLSIFCKEKGPLFFKQFFYKLTGLLLDFGLIDDKQAGIIDSAPVEACMNFARANTGPKLDLERVRAFFEAIDFTAAVALARGNDQGTGSGKKKTFTDEMLVKFLCFQQTCGFLSRNQAITYLKKHADMALILGIPAGKVLSNPTVSNFEKRAPPVRMLMKPLVAQMTDFFDEHPDYDENDPLAFFFWSPESWQGPS